MKFINDAILDVIGASSYVVMDTDYDTYGMVCTCQVLFFSTSFSFFERSPRINVKILAKADISI